MTLDDLLKLLQGGSSAFIPFALWLAYKAIRTGEDAVETLKRIEQSNTGVRTAIDDHNGRMESKLDDVKDAVLRLPLELVKIRAG